MSAFEVRIEGDARVVARGEVDIATAPQLSSAISSLAGDPSRRVVLDVAGVTFMDSSGISALVLAAAELADQGALLVLGPTSTQVDSVLQIAGLENHFTRDQRG